MLLKPQRIIPLMIVLAGALALAQSEPKKVSLQESIAAIKSKTAPEYPAIAKQLKIEGEVTVEALVNETGAVERVDIVKGNPVLTRSAADAVKRWKFAPFEDGGKPCKALATLSLTFKL